MTAFQEPLEKGWLKTVLRDVRAEVDSWKKSSEHLGSSRHEMPSSPEERVELPLSR